jgi:hypothetical protein
MMLTMPHPNALLPLEQEAWDQLQSERRQGQIRPGTEATYDRLAQKVAAQKVPSYISPHFPGIPNYVAHLRVNDRTDAEGKPGLFLEEIQSDRHQQARVKGYKEDVTYTPEDLAREGLTLEFDYRGNPS